MSYSGGFFPIEVDNTFYVYDAGGAQVAMYKGGVGQSLGYDYNLSSHTLYGAGSVGLLDKITGKALYELSDHLGNVKAVVTTSTNGAAETVSYTDYYAHGNVMPDRTYQSSLNFPYGYQGQEKDAATGLTNFELRQYDPRIGRWYNPDPYGQHYSPYLAMSNNPISSIDPDGGTDVGFNGGFEDDFISPLQSQHVFGGDDWINNMEFKANYGIDMNNYNGYRAMHKDGTQWGKYYDAYQYTESKHTNGGYSKVFIADFQYQAERPNYMSGGMTVSFFHKNEMEGHNKDGNMYKNYVAQQRWSKNNPNIRVAIVDGYDGAADYLEQLEKGGINPYNIIFNSHGNLSKEGSFNFGKQILSSPQDVNVNAFKRMGNVMKPGGTVVVAGCHSGGNIYVMGAIARASGRNVLAPIPLVKPGLVFKGEVISYFPDEYIKQYDFIREDKAILTSPAATPNGFISRDTPMFGVNPFGAIFYK